MVAPVTGPLNQNSSNSVKGPASFRCNIVNYRQKRPYNLSLYHKYFFARNIGTNFASTSPDNQSSSSGNWRAGGTKFYVASDAEIYDARFKAMEKFRSNLSDRAEWLVNFAERAQAAKMVTGAAIKLLSLAYYCKRLDYRKMARALSAPSNIGKNAKSAGALWLEYHFGWEPMIQDIHTGIDILQKPIGNKSVYGKGKLRRTDLDHSHTTNYNTDSKRILKAFVKVGATAEVTNPMLWRANQLGLVNPASVAWELVPFSFVVDWFIPVGQFLNSWTEFLGLSIKNQYTSALTEEVIEYYLSPLVGGIPAGYASNKSISFERVTTLPVTELRAPSLRSPSLTRAATAISLLLQQFKSF